PDFPFSREWVTIPPFGRTIRRGGASERRSMNVGQFLEHWGIRENPFRAEEARRDEVFARLPPGAVAEHSDFEKVLGDLARPATSIVFGEKGSGKTAMRLQITRRIGDFNEANPQAKVLLVAYDDLNVFLD